MTYEFWLFIALTATFSVAFTGTLWACQHLYEVKVTRRRARKPMATKVTDADYRPLP